MTGARNGGCEALLSSILDGLSTIVDRQTVPISLQSADPHYDQFIFQGRVDRVFSESSLPYTAWPIQLQRLFFGIIGMKRLTSWPRYLHSVRNLTQADLIIATGGDVFTSDYDSFEHHARVLQIGRPVALLAHTVGPLKPKAKVLFQRSLRHIALCTVRETESLEYLTDQFPELDAKLTADVAFLLPATPRDVIERIIEQELHFPLDGRPLIGISLSAGISSYRNDVSKDDYLRESVALIDELNMKGYSTILLAHVRERSVTNNDIYACQAVLRRCSRPQDNLMVAHDTLSASDLKAIIGLCCVVIAARTHVAIAAMSQNVPTISIAYSRKAWGIMRDFYGRELGDKLTIDAADMSRGRLLDGVAVARSLGDFVHMAEEFKRRAEMNFEMLLPHIPGSAFKA